MAARSEAEVISLLVYKSPAWKGGVLYSEPRRGWIWQTLVHRTTRARRVTGGLLVSYASRFSSGSRFAAAAIFIILPISRWGCLDWHVEHQHLHRVASLLTSRH